MGGGSDVYNGRVEPMLVSLSDSYLEDKEISVCDSGPSSSPTYTITDYLSTGYCPNGNVFYFVLRRTFYSKCVKIVDGGLYFISSFHFILLFFSFSFFYF